ncbi:MAG: hypothetical protein HWN66_18555 [Candidatus Helarchaeota archaeon]|nr:hypothetical protein [Candidatus Helarchaeota archaeon]
MRKKYFILMSLGFGILLLSLIIPAEANHQVTLYSEDFATLPGDWSFTNNNNNWQTGLIPFGDHSMDGNGLGTELLINYADNVNEMIEAQTPTINLQGYTNIKLSFYHWYNFSDSLNDGGGIYLWNGTGYINPLNDFPSAVTGDLNTHVINGLEYPGHLNEKGWAYNSSDVWLQVVIDLSQIGLSNSDFNVTFVFGENETDTIHGMGWYIDDIHIFEDQQPTNWTWLILIIIIIAGVIATSSIYHFTHESDLDTKKYEIGEETSGTETTTPTTTETPTPTTPTETTPSTTTTPSTPTQPTPSTPTTPTPSPTPTPTPTTTPGTSTTPTPSTTTPTTPQTVPTPAPVSTSQPRIKWNKVWTLVENPLYEDGYYYEITFEVPCSITPEANQVVVAHIVVTVTAQCKNGTYTITLDYWEAFTLHDRTEDKTTTRDKHFLDLNETINGILSQTNCDEVLSFTATRTHTVGLGTVQGAAWYGQEDGGSFAYLSNGPPPQNQPSVPAVRPHENVRVQGSVTSFNTATASTFTGTYTYNAQTGTQTYTSSANPGTTYTFPE